ncbi:MAG TPA: hypothetical protein VGB82_12935 [Alphaproteobacteria bacterium]
MTDDIEADFTAAVRRAGLTLDEDRVAAMRDAYRELQKLLAVLDAPLVYAEEPAFALDLTRIEGTR